MKKNLPYIAGVVALIILAVLVISSTKKLPRRMDETITLKHLDKIPYGTAAAKTLLPSLFKNAKIYADNKSPLYWDSIQPTSYNQAVILVAKYFYPEHYQLQRLADFAANGNYVFIISNSFSSDAQEYFNFSNSESSLYELMNDNQDSLAVKLEKPSFSSDSTFIYPGKKFKSWFTELDTGRVIILGRDENNEPNFIRVNRGNGAIFIHTAPLAFSNYFILHKNNIQYFESAMSVIPNNVDKILWNEYYLMRPAYNEDKEPNWLGVLFKHSQFKWGLITAIAALLLYILLASRRKQRMIPNHPKPKNDSLDFVKTLGRLYYDRRDHHNLAKKLAAYFLDHVRSVYKLSTNELDDDFVQNLQYKSGYDMEELKKIISFITYLDEVPFIPETELITFHKQLEAFYQTT